MTTSALIVMIAAAVVTAVLIALVVLRSRTVSTDGKEAPSRILAEHVVDMVSTHDPDGTFRYVSSVFAGLLGEYPGTLVGKHPRDYAHHDDGPALAGLWKRAINLSGASTAATWRCRRHDGEYAWIETTARAAPAESTELGAIICGSRDVTERRQIEDALRDSEQRFRSTLETVRLVAVGLDAEGRVTFLNDALLSLTGWQRTELLGESWFDRCVPPGDPARAAFLSNIARGEVLAQYEHEIVCRDGSRRTIAWDNTLLHSPRGEVAGMASLGADVTERRIEEATLNLLQSITVAISASNDLDAALLRTLESLSGATGWGYGEAWLPTSDGEHLERGMHYTSPGVSAEPLSLAGASTRFTRGEGLPGRAWKSKTIEWIPELAGITPERSRLHTAAQCGFHAVVAIPVMAGDEVVAILSFFMDRPRATDERHTRMIFVVANQVGAVIARRRAQKQYEGEILNARDEAQAASRAKSEFLSRMSHELRTPLNSVIGFANVMRKNKSGRLTSEELAFLDRIVANGQHLLTLVNNVLDIAKVEAGRLTVATTLVNVDELILDVVAQLEGQPRDPGVELLAEVPGELIPIESDIVLLRQVLINLVGNALRFTHAGSVTVVAIADPQTGAPTKIEVRDTGVGIPLERQRAVFEPFEQGDVDTHLSYGGTGLGLSISKAICDALGYGLTLVSEPGKGSTFAIHLASAAGQLSAQPVDSDGQLSPSHLKAV